MFRRYALFNTSSVFYPDHISLVETLKVSIRVLPSVIYSFFQTVNLLVVNVAYYCYMKPFTRLRDTGNRTGTGHEKKHSHLYDKT